MNTQMKKHIYYAEKVKNSREQISYYMLVVSHYKTPDIIPWQQM